MNRLAVDARGIHHSPFRFALTIPELVATEVATLPGAEQFAFQCGEKAFATVLSIRCGEAA